VVVEYRGTGRVVRPLAIEAISLSHKPSTTLSHGLVTSRQIGRNDAGEYDPVEGAGPADTGDAGSDFLDVAKMKEVRPDERAEQAGDKGDGRASRAEAAPRSPQHKKGMGYAYKSQMKIPAPTGKV